MALNPSNSSNLSVSVPRAPLASFDADTPSPSSSDSAIVNIIPPLHTGSVDAIEAEIQISTEHAQVSTWKLRSLSYGWVIVIGAFLVNFIQEGLQFNVSVMFEPFNNEFNSTKAMTAWIPAIFLAMPHLSAPIASVLINKFGCRSMTIVGALLAGTGVGFSTRLFSLSMIFLHHGVIGGFGISLIDVASNTILTQYFDKNISLVSGIAVSGGGLGLLVLMTLTDYLLKTYGWRYTNLVSAGIYLLIALCGLLFRPPSQEGVLCTSLDDVNAFENVQQNTISPKGNIFKRLPVFFKNTAKVMFEPFQYKNFGLFVVSNFILYLFYDLPYLFVPTNAMKMSWLIRIMGIFNVIGQIILGWLGDKKRVNSQVVYALTIILSGVAVGLMPLTQTPLSIFFTAAFFGIFISGNYALTNIILKKQILTYLSSHGNDLTNEKLLEHKLTNSYGLLLFIQGVANIIGPPLGGWFFDLYDFQDIIFYIGGSGIIISGVIMVVRPIQDFYKKFQAVNL